MGARLLVVVIGVGGFLGGQLTGMVGRAGRARGWLGADRTEHAPRLDDALQRTIAASGGRSSCQRLHRVGWVIGALEAFLILVVLGLPASLAMATGSPGTDGTVVPGESQPRAWSSRCCRLVRPGCAYRSLVA
jgi:hypothetical protein